MDALCILMLIPVVYVSLRRSEWSQNRTEYLAYNKAEFKMKRKKKQSFQAAEDRNTMSGRHTADLKHA
jgi:hypothetical protein